MRIALVINYAEREKLSMECIARQIMLLDPQSSVLIVEYRDPEHMAKLLAFQPETLLMFPLTARTLAYIPYIMKAAFRTRILFYRTEGIFIANTPDRVRFMAGQGRYGPCCTDGELFWGDAHAAEISNLLYQQKKLSSPTQRTGIVGHVPFGADFAAKLAPLPHDILDRVRAFPRNRILLFLTGFHFADYTPADIRRAQDIIPQNCSDISSFMRDIQICINGTKALRNSWIKSILSIAIENPDLLLIVKPHPLEFVQKQDQNFDYYEEFFSGIPNILYLQENYHIISLLQEVGALIHYGSTSAAFSYRYNIYTIFADYPELFESIKDKEGMVYYDDIGLGGDSRVHIKDLPLFIKKHKQIFDRYEQRQEVLDILKSFFHYLPDQKISPSQIIARILLTSEDFPYQEIDNNIDKHFFSVEALSHLPYCITILQQLTKAYQRSGDEKRTERTLNALKRIGSMTASL